VAQIPQSDRAQSAVVGRRCRGWADRACHRHGGRGALHIAGRRINRRAGCRTTSSWTASGRSSFADPDAAFANVPASSRRDGRSGFV